MPEITIDNDSHVYKITIKKKGAIYVDGFELVSFCSELEGVLEGKEPTPKDTANAVREIAWSEDCNIEELTNHELFSAGTKALLEIKKLGNL